MIKGFILGVVGFAGWKYIRPILKKAKVLPWTKLVKFEDGTYGVRRSLIICYIYKDLDSNHHWWLRNATYFSDCKGTLERAQEVINNRGDIGNPV